VIELRFARNRRGLSPDITILTLSAEGARYGAFAQLDRRHRIAISRTRRDRGYLAPPSSVYRTGDPISAASILEIVEAAEREYFRSETLPLTHT